MSKKPTVKKPALAFKAWSVLRRGGHWTKVDLEIEGNRVVKVAESQINLQDIVLQDICDEAIAQANGE